jgi:hypothetical protein
MADTVILHESESRGGLGTIAIAAGALGAAVLLWRRGRSPDDVPPRRGGPTAAPEPRRVASAPNPDATSPSVPRYVGPSEPIPRTFDPIFAREGQGIPVAYLRALAAHESNLKPDLAKSPAWGLVQVVEIVRRDYNERHGASYERNALLDPAVNVRIAADLLAFIAESYGKNHTAPNLREDWQNPRFVELLTMGWNAGYSEKAGVGRVARYLENTGTPVTVATVNAAARTVGATERLSDPLKVIYARAVTATYLRERERDLREGYTVASAAVPIAPAPIVLVPARAHLVAVAPAPTSTPAQTDGPHEIAIAPAIVETHHTTPDAVRAAQTDASATHEAQHAARTTETEANATHATPKETPS